MSNLYKEYLEKKEEDNKKIYLFKVGNFYYALASDAILLNKEFDLKITKFSNNCDKCGFPLSELKK